MASKKATPKPPEVRHLYKHATLYELGTTWVVLFSDSCKVCDLVRYTAKKELTSQLGALHYLERWIRPKSSTVFLSYLDDRGHRKGHWLKKDGQLLNEVLEQVKAQVAELALQSQVARKRLGLPH
jgi:hypothetical protein